MFNSIETGPNHTVAISQNNNKVYVWGHNNLQNRLGLKDEGDNHKAKSEPTILYSLEHEIEKKKEDRKQFRAQDDINQEVVGGGEAEVA